jgi:organic hydroperoxide reductase OsmC/OhrA
MSEDARRYDVRVVWTGEKSADVSLDDKLMVKTGVSPEFGDNERVPTPEDLFVASAAVCFMNGFVEFIKKMRLEFKSFECQATGLLEKVGRSFEITRIDMDATVVIDNEEIRDRVERALELADKYCFIGNSMKCPITHKNSIVVE